MTSLKKQYYLYVENTNNIDLEKINKRYKFTIIYRNNKTKEKIEIALQTSKVMCCRTLLMFMRLKIIKPSYGVPGLALMKLISQSTHVPLLLNDFVA